MATSELTCSVTVRLVGGKHRMTTEEKGSAQPAPDQVVLNRIQVSRLAKLTGLPAAELSDRSIASLSERYRWTVNPIWFLFERVCGRVVKVDPGTGVKYPVPGATVNVVDVDCDWLWYFPVD